MDQKHSLSWLKSYFLSRHRSAAGHPYPHATPMDLAESGALQSAKDGVFLHSVVFPDGVQPSSISPQYLTSLSEIQRLNTGRRVFVLSLFIFCAVESGALC